MTYVVSFVDSNAPVDDRRFSCPNDAAWHAAHIEATTGRATVVVVAYQPTPLP